ncbi:MAG: N-acetylmuramoyl-L-alanine amidase [Gemmatimonadetes bacterium]|nr:N-acetylmuramoyl-L-alanine amidase [Gemmatimonadota bacterium]
MGLSRNASWRPAVGLGLLVPAIAVSVSFAPDARNAEPGPGLSASAWDLLPHSAGPAPSPSATDASAILVSPTPVAPGLLPASFRTAPDDGRTAPLIALQAGHWLSSEAPAELRRLQYNGTTGGGKSEWEVTLEIAQRTARLLEEQGYVVEILPATVPPQYTADLFIAIHADGNNASSVSGFTIGAPRRDVTRRAAQFVEVLADSYAEATSLRRRTNVTRRMQNYYAFNSRRFDHAIDPMTVAVIIETGFLTNPGDRAVIVDNQDLSARGIANAVVRFVPIPQAEPSPITVGL